MVKHGNVLIGSFLLSVGFILNGIVPAYASEIETGKKIYEDKKCGICHIVAGKGGEMGPDLSDVGKRRDRDWLMRFLKNPKEVKPGAGMMPVKGSDQELSSIVDYLVSLKK